ncbi:MAG: hypothetical protein M3173_09410 [Chloroflexota bacterium]|nr:hypothetical protein [Chloroflexota bacterium]
MPNREAEVVIVPVTTMMVTTSTTGTVAEPIEQPTDAAASALATPVAVKQIQQIVEHGGYLLAAGHTKTPAASSMDAPGSGHARSPLAAGAGADRRTE